MSSTQKRAILQVRIREEDKQHAEHLYDAMGTSLAEAVRLFVAQSILMRKLPFQPVAVRSKDGTAAYGSLKAYGDPNRRAEERNAWIEYLEAENDGLVLAPRKLASMSSTIIDETVILRYLLDDEILSPRAAKVIATRTARVYPEIITRVAVTLRDVYKVPRTKIAAAMTRLLDDVMVDEPTVVALAVKLFGKTHMDFTDCLLAARTAIYNDDVVSFGKPIIQGMIDYRRKRINAAEARERATDATIDKLRHRPRS